MSCSDTTGISGIPQCVLSLKPGCHQRSYAWVHGGHVHSLAESLNSAHGQHGPWISQRYAEKNN